MAIPGKVTRLAMIGLGNQGREHLHAAKTVEGIQFVAGVDLSETMRSEVSRQFPGIKVLSSLSELSRESVDGLVMALPHHAYEPLWDVISGLELPILKEKPLARSYLEALSFLSRLQEPGVRLQTAIQRRHHPSYKWLKDQIDERGVAIEEIHAHMHLGLPQGAAEGTWRDQRKLSGGGALLDAGYHLVDLVMYLAGSFDLISSTLSRSGRLLTGQETEDRVCLLGRSSRAWIHIESQIHSEKKSEMVRIKAGPHLWLANREGVWCDGTQLYDTDRSWEKALRSQLIEFANNIASDTWHNQDIWDQLPAMRIIDEAYQKAFTY